MKKILLSIATFLAAISSLQATPNLYETSPETYNKQVFSFGLSSNSEAVTINGKDEDIVDLGGNLGIVLSNKATIKNFDYRSGELYWRGLGAYNMEFSGEWYTFDLELATGLNYKLPLIFTNLDFGGRYKYITSESNNALEETSHDSNTEFFISGTIGFPITNHFNAGASLEYASGKGSLAGVDMTYTKNTFSIPVTYKAYKDISVNFIPSYSKKTYENDIEGEEIKAMLVASWAYNN